MTATAGRAAPWVERSVTVRADPEAVWRALATGAGLSSWYRPRRVEEGEGGAITDPTDVGSLADTHKADDDDAGPGSGDHGDGRVVGRITVWDPPRRLVIEGEDLPPVLSAEWRITPGPHRTCAVDLRIVEIDPDPDDRPGTGPGAAPDPLIESVDDHWATALNSLAVHLDRFGGRPATTLALTATTALAPPADARAAWLGRLGLPPNPTKGQPVRLDPAGAPCVVGAVLDVTAHHLLVAVEQPALGFATVTVGPLGRHGNGSALVILLHLYGPEGEAVVRRHGAQWNDWFADR